MKKSTFFISIATVLTMFAFITIFGCVKATQQPEAVETVGMAYVAETVTPTAGPKTAEKTIEETLGISVTRVDDGQVKGDVYHLHMLDQKEQSALVARVIKPSATNCRFVFLTENDTFCAEAQNVCKNYINQDVAMAPDEELFNKVNSNEFEFAYRQGDDYIDCYMKQRSMCSSVWTIDADGNLSLFWYNRNNPEIARMYENQ